MHQKSKYQKKTEENKLKFQRRCEKNKIELENKCIRIQEKMAEAEAWRGRNEELTFRKSELDFKVELMKKYQEFQNMGMTNEQIVAFCSDMKPVIDSLNTP